MYPVGELILKKNICFFISCKFFIIDFCKKKYFNKQFLHGFLLAIFVFANCPTIILLERGLRVIWFYDITSFGYIYKCFEFENLTFLPYVLYTFLVLHEKKIYQSFLQNHQLLSLFIIQK